MYYNQLLVKFYSNIWEWFHSKRTFQTRYDVNQGCSHSKTHRVRSLWAIYESYIIGNLQFRSDYTKRPTGSKKLWIMIWPWHLTQGKNWLHWQLADSLPIAMGTIARTTNYGGIRVGYGSNLRRVAQAKHRPRTGHAWVLEVVDSQKRLNSTRRICWCCTRSHCGWDAAAHKALSPARPKNPYL